MFSLPPLEELLGDALLSDDVAGTWLDDVGCQPACGSPFASSSAAIPIKGAHANSAHDLQDSSLESTQSILGAADDPSPSRYHGQPQLLYGGSLATYSQPAWASFGSQKCRQQQQQCYGTGAGFGAPVVGPAYQQFSIEDFDMLLPPSSSDSLYLPEEPETLSEGPYGRPQHFHPYRPYPAEQQQQRQTPGPAPPAQQADSWQCGPTCGGGAVWTQHGQPPEQQGQQCYPYAGEYYPQQQQQQHVQGFYEIDEEEQEEGSYGTNGTEESDATMQAMNSPSPQHVACKSPTSLPLSHMDTATQAAPAARRAMRHAGSTGSGHQRIRLVVKHQEAGAAAAVRPPPVRPSAAAIRAAQAAARASRPRRASSLRVASYASALDAFDEEEDAAEGARAVSAEDGDTPYQSAGEEGSLVSCRAAANGPAASLQPAGKKKHNPWTQEETEALIEGVRFVGVGKWAEIKKLPMASVAGVLLNRSAVDLKDKWRNLSRVARLPKSALKSRLAKGGSDTPLELVLAVKELLDTSRADHREWQ